MIRLQTAAELEGEEGEKGQTHEFIVYDLSQTRYDDLNNRYHFMRERMGEYNIPYVRKEVLYDNENQQQERVIGIDHIDIAYEVPFTKENAEELHRYCRDNVPAKMGKTQYIVQKANDIKISVRSYKDSLYGDFETLWKTGTADAATKSKITVTGK